MGGSNLSVNPLGSCSVSTHDVIPLNHSSDPHTLRAIFQSTFHAHNFALRSNKDIGPVGDLARKRKSKIQRTACFQIALNHNIQSLSGDIPRLPFLAQHQFLSGESYTHRESQIVTPCQPTLCH